MFFYTLFSSQFSKILLIPITDQLLGISGLDMQLESGLCLGNPQPLHPRHTSQLPVRSLHFPMPAPFVGPPERTNIFTPLCHHSSLSSDDDVGSRGRQPGF